ncbi:MAG: LysR family transcriptional regulator [Gammaproteobacteria bacterium]|nr:LysR family transcriptional regulator [Gammaproteobacteria bacterium]
MKLSNIDLNLLVYFSVLLREGNVTKAAEHLGLSQPAMSNGLRRLRKVFNDPLLVRTSNGMMPTDKARELQPKVQQVLAQIELFVQPTIEFDPSSSKRLFRVMASDYAETTLLPRVRTRMAEEAPDTALDILTPSDVTFQDIELGNVDLVINRFDQLPQSLHLSVLWQDRFSCVMRRDNPACEGFNFDKYLAANHVWVNKTGMGVATGVNPDDVQKLGWVDIALNELGKRRNIAVYTRHYISAIQLTQQQDLIATVAHRATHLVDHFSNLAIFPAPFEIPDIELHMVWSPLLHHNIAHKWFRNVIRDVAHEIQAEENT